MIKIQHGYGKIKPVVTLQVGDGVLFPKSSSLQLQLAYVGEMEIQLIKV